MVRGVERMDKSRRVYVVGTQISSMLPRRIGQPSGIRSVSNIVRPIEYTEFILGHGSVGQSDGSW